MNPQQLSHYEIAQRVAELEPGGSVTFSAEQIRRMGPPIYHNGAKFTVPDRILENVIGSAFQWRYTTHPKTGAVTFNRLKHTAKAGVRSYVSPDRRKFYREEDGFFMPI